MELKEGNISETMDMSNFKCKQPFYDDTKNENITLTKWEPTKVPTSKHFALFQNVVPIFKIMEKKTTKCAPQILRKKQLARVKWWYQKECECSQYQNNLTIMILTPFLVRNVPWPEWMGKFLVERSGSTCVWSSIFEWWN